MQKHAGHAKTTKGCLGWNLVRDTIIYHGRAARDLCTKNCWVCKEIFDPVSDETLDRVGQGPAEKQEKIKEEAKEKEAKEDEEQEEEDKEGPDAARESSSVAIVAVASSSQAKKVFQQKVF